MSITYARFPMEIVIKVAKILNAKDYFVELESIVHIFPALSKLIRLKVPTVVLVDDDQYEKFSNFIFSRERPFGSRELFIIKQRCTLKPDDESRSQSKCYIVLSSEWHQRHIPRIFRVCLNKCVTLIEQKNNLIDSSVKTYELVWNEPKLLDNDEQPIDLPRLYKQNIPFRYSHHVGVMLRIFVKYSNPRLLRFEAYSGKNDLYLEWEQLYSIYSSLICSYYPKDRDDFLDKTRFGRDSNLNMPKCCFEFIKDINQLSSLKQHLTRVDPNSNSTLEEFADDKKDTTAFFDNLESITVDKVVSNSQSHEINSSNSFILVNCSKSATPNKSAYQFVQNYYSFVLSVNKATAYFGFDDQLHENSASDDQFLTRSEFASTYNPARSQYRPNYMNLLHLDFSIEKLQSADITAVHISDVISSVPFTYAKKKKISEKTYSYDEMTSLSNRLNLKILQNKVNRALKSIQDLRQLHEYKLDLEQVSTLLSQQAMTTIVHEVTKNIESESLNKEQPLKLRVFQNDIQRMNLPIRNQYVETWFSEYHRDDSRHTSH